MPEILPVRVYLVPQLLPENTIPGHTAVVIDVLRATTTIVFALAAGCKSVRPCAEIEEAKELAAGMRVDRSLLAGEREGRPIAGFDLGNSPQDFTRELCEDSDIVFTTTNGTRALLRAADAERVMLAAFVNFSAVCEQLAKETRPIHIICAGTNGDITQEDTLLAGALVDHLCEVREVELNDAGRLAWDCFENHGALLLETLQLSRGGANLVELGYHDDIRAAADVDRFAFVPELRCDPLRIEIGAVGFTGSYWPK